MVARVYPLQAGKYVLATTLDIKELINVNISFTYNFFLLVSILFI